jgi:hypothetical protein
LKRADMNWIVTAQVFSLDSEGKDDRADQFVPKQRLDVPFNSASVDRYR